MTDEKGPEPKLVEVTWRRAFKVWWSLLWRQLLFGGLSGGLIGAILGSVLAIAGEEPDTIAKVCRIAGMVAGLPVSLAVTRFVLKKRYSDFRIALVERQRFSG